MIKALNHLGIAVASLERSVEFYCRGFDMKVVEEEGFGGEQYEHILALKGVCGKLALLKTGDFHLELFQFSQPRSRPGDPKRPVSDLGITHFCIEVTDIDSTCERLKTLGASFHCPPSPFAGNIRATYGRDPDGNVFELMERTLERNE